jgi:hypothetical protein
MYLSNSKYWYSNNCSHFSKRAVPFIIYSFMLVNEDSIKVPMSYFELWLNQLKAGRKSTWINGSR